MRLPLFSNPCYMKQNFQRLTDKILDRYLDIKVKERDTKSGVSPSAQIVTLCLPGTADLAEEIGLLNSLEKIKKEIPPLFYLIKFMESSACRINEVLSMKSSDITQTGLVKIKGSKKSKARIVSGGMATDYLLKCKKTNIIPWSEWSRFFVYKQFRKYGIVMQLKGRKNKSVTHAIRHQAAKEIKKAGIEQELSKQALGHSTTKANNYYYE